MRPFLIIVSYLAAALLIGAALAWPLQQILQPLADISLYRAMTRTGMLIALFGIYPLLRYLEVNSLQALGLRLPLKNLFREVARGLLIGVAIMLPLVLALYGLNVLIAETAKPLSAAILIVLALKALFAGLLISLIEEVFFRGAMYAAIIRHRGMLFTAVSSSALYASLHFIDTDLRDVTGQADWMSGFTILAASLRSFLSPEIIVDSLLALLMAGIFLSLVRQRTGNIARCIGIHTGWIIVIKLTRYLTDSNPAADYASLVGSYNGIIGYLAMAWLALITFFYWSLSRNRRAR